MARHTDAAAAQQQAVEVSQQEQKELLEKLGPMTRKALRGLYEALVATKLCYMCLGRPGTEKDPLKVDVEGKCINCAGHGRVQDFEKFKWAFEEIMGRKLPMPKAIELKVEDKSDRAALFKVFAGMSKGQVLEMERIWDAQLKKMSGLISNAEVVDVSPRPD